ncbi:MAG TPA: hypothetical protein OIM45_08155 [Clostridiaceae bacterium]|nr:hypothetical protein [Clostridiaceae bacterium]
MSRLADEIMSEYFKKKYYSKRKRQKCTDKKCIECKLRIVCEGWEENETTQ